jgi:hypothetical protein
MTESGKDEANTSIFLKSEVFGSKIRNAQIIATDEKTAGELNELVPRRHIDPYGWCCSGISEEDPVQDFEIYPYPQIDLILEIICSHEIKHDINIIQDSAFMFKMNSKRKSWLIDHKHRSDVYHHAIDQNIVIFNYIKKNSRTFFQFMKLIQQHLKSGKNNLKYIF